MFVQAARAERGLNWWPSLVAVQHRACWQGGMCCMRRAQDWQDARHPCHPKDRQDSMIGYWDGGLRPDRGGETGKSESRNWGGLAHRPIRKCGLPSWSASVRSAVFESCEGTGQAVSRHRELGGFGWRGTRALGVGSGQLAPSRRPQPRRWASACRAGGTASPPGGCLPGLQPWPGSPSEG